MVTAKQRQTREKNQGRKTPRGPPRVLVRRHVLEIKEDTQEFLSKQINKLIAVRVTGKGIEAVGEAVKGAVSHPLGFLAVSAAVTAALLGYFGGSNEKEEETVEFLKEQLGVVGLPPELGDAFKIAFDFSRTMFPFIPGLPTIGEPPVPPLTAHEKRCNELAAQLATSQANLAAEGNPAFRKTIEASITATVEAQIEEGC